jgi:hypothetical protein
VIIYDIDNKVFYLWYCCIIFKLLSLNPIILIKSFTVVSRYDKKSNFSKVVSSKDMAEMVCRKINY